MILVDDIVSFILRYRNGTRAFNNGETATEIKDCICCAISDECCVVNSSPLDRITGVIVGQLEHKERNIHIVGILCITSESLARFAAWLKQRHDREGWTITAKRRGKFVKYNTERLLTKLITLYGG